jgi:hypothetical protein
LSNTQHTQDASLSTYSGMLTYSGMCS